MRNNKHYYSLRIQLEKLKRKTWLCVIWARILFLLGLIASFLLK